jgi:hypothetical protein
MQGREAHHYKSRVMQGGAALKNQAGAALKIQGYAGRRITKNPGLCRATQH